MSEVVQVKVTLLRGLPKVRINHVALRVEVIDTHEIRPVVQLLKRLRKSNLAGDEAVVVEVVHLLVILQLMALMSQTRRRSCLHLKDVSRLYGELQMENRTIVLLILSPTAVKQGLFEVIVLLANEDAVFLRQLISLPVKIPVSDHWA